MLGVEWPVQLLYIITNDFLSCNQYTGMWHWLLIGYLFFSFTSGSKEGEENISGVPSLKWKVGTLNVHFHHWVSMLVLYMVNHLLIGWHALGYFSLGGTLHGLSYNDYHKVIWVDPANGLKGRNAAET